VADDAARALEQLHGLAAAVRGAGGAQPLHKAAAAEAARKLLSNCTLDVRVRLSALLAPLRDVCAVLGLPVRLS
jgi:hypothetical protein